MNLVWILLAFAGAVAVVTGAVGEALSPVTAYEQAFVPAPHVPPGGAVWQANQTVAVAAHAPPTEERQARPPGALPDADRAKSFVVRFSGGYLDGTHTIHSYSIFAHMSRTTESKTVDYTKYLDKTPSFVLESLPGDDKKAIYEMVHRYINAGAESKGFSVSVDLVSGDGRVIQTWDYRKCAVNDYYVYVDSDRDTVNFSGADDEMEIREGMVVACAGFDISVANKKS